MTIRTTLAVSLALAAAVLPVFLFGALSGALRADLGFGAAATGAAATLFFAAAAAGAAPMGRVTERIGAGVAMRIGVTVSALVCLGIGTLARTWWHVAALMAAGGLVVGLIDTGGARAFADRVHAGRQGLAFGVKEASVPVASMLAGASIPLLLIRFGWQTTFAAGAVFAPLVWIALPRLPAARAVPANQSQPQRRSLLLVAVGVGLGAGAATAGAAFLVPAATSSISVAAAGTLLAGASLVSVLARLATGWLADRTERPPIRLMAAAMVAGGVGAGLLVGSQRVTLVLGAVLLLGAGWGWTGLAFLTAVRTVPEAPAAAAGIVLTGLALGGTAGPFLFQAAVSAGSYGWAWAAVAVALATGAVVTLLGGRQLGAIEARAEPA